MDDHRNERWSFRKEVSIAGKLRSERAHFEKHSAGIIPKSGMLHHASKT